MSRPSKIISAVVLLAIVAAGFVFALSPPTKTVDVAKPATPHVVDVPFVNSSLGYSIKMPSDSRMVSNFQADVAHSTFDPRHVASNAYLPFDGGSVCFNPSKCDEITFSVVVNQTAAEAREADVRCPLGDPDGYLIGGVVATVELCEYYIIASFKRGKDKYILSLHTQVKTRDLGRFMKWVATFQFTNAKPAASS